MYRCYILLSLVSGAFTKLVASNPCMKQWNAYEHKVNCVPAKLQTDFCSHA